MKELKGTESTMKSIQKLRLSTPTAAKIPNIDLSVSYQGVTFIDRETNVSNDQVTNLSLKYVLC